MFIRLTIIPKRKTAPVIKKLNPGTTKNNNKEMMNNKFMVP